MTVQRTTRCPACGGHKDRDAETCRRCWLEQRPAEPPREYGGKHVEDQGDEGRHE